MSGNLGASPLRRARRAGNPMHAYDRLPPDLRRLMNNAALPWSPRSCARLWEKARARGLAPEEALVALSNAEARTLARDRNANLSDKT